MRVVFNDSDEKKLILLKNRYNKILAEYELKVNEELDLPLYQKALKLIDTSNNKEIFVYGGFSAINLSNCYKRYDFKGLKAQEVDYYLQNGKFKPKMSVKNRQKVLDYIELIGINYADYVLIPPLYESIEQELCLT